MSIFFKFGIWVFGYGFGFSVKILDFQKYNLDNQIKFQVFRQILDKNLDIFRVLNIFRYFSIFLG